MILSPGQRFDYKGELPDVIRDFTASIRAALRAVGDDGTYGSFRHRVNVKAGWAETRAIDNLNARLNAVKKSRNKYKAQLAAVKNSLEQHRNDVVDHNLINDAAVLRLLRDAGRLASGEMHIPEEVAALHARIKKVLARAKRVDKRKSNKEYPLF